MKTNKCVWSDNYTTCDGEIKITGMYMDQLMAPLCDRHEKYSKLQSINAYAGVADDYRTITGHTIELDVDIEKIPLEVMRLLFKLSKTGIYSKEAVRKILENYRVVA